ncbi:MAG: restriction endonuclease subunit S [Verrucomicrobia bacterium]|nr:restriction endonuclease subunit S [Verrucomicrobiota bacterium]
MRVKAGALAEQVRGVSYGKDDASDSQLPGYLPVLRAGNITDDGLVYDDLVFVPKERVSEKQKIRRHDVVIAASSGSLDVVGKAAPALSDFDGSFGAFCKVLRPNAKVHPSYFAHFFKTLDYRRRVSALAAGANINNLRNEHLDDMEIPLPPLAEQRRIAEVLDRAEALRAKRRAALAQLDSLTQSLFLDLFGDPATNPKGLPIEPMDKLFSVKHGFAFKSEYFTDAGEFTLLTPGNFYEGGGYRDRGDKQKYYVGPMPTGYTLNKDDLLVAMTEQAPGLLGSPILIPESNKFLHNQRLGLVEVKPGADRLFLFHLFNTPAVRNQIQASSTGTKVKHTSPSKITAIKIPVPPITLQREFARRVTAVEALKTAQRASLAELDALFATLQHRAFRGELFGVPPSGGAADERKGA